MAVLSHENKELKVQLQKKDAVIAHMKQAFPITSPPTSGPRGRARAPATMAYGEGTDQPKDRQISHDQLKISAPR